MEFKEFKSIMNIHVSGMLKKYPDLFVTGTDKDQLWSLYLDSFPPGTNEIFRKQREFDCSCCRQFIKSFGSVVAISESNEIVSIWDFKVNDNKYQLVVDALSKYVKSFAVEDFFVTKQSILGTEKSRELMSDKHVHVWHHFSIRLPKALVLESFESVESIMGSLRDVRNVFKRSLEEISIDSIESVLDLIAQNSLYKGAEWKNVLDSFKKFHQDYSKLDETKKDNYCWAKSTKVGVVVGKIRNHSIGVLLTDITKGVELNKAVERYEKIVAPANYKRPKAIFTARMVEQAQKTIAELGLSESLQRRFARIDDITVNNILFANRDSLKLMNEDVFSKLKMDVVKNSKHFDKVEEVNIETFVKEILPRVTDIQVYVENMHEPNFVSVIAPQVDSPTLFKWNNSFSWAYKGNVTDSMRERVKLLGGRVENVVSRFSIQWNEDGGDNDLDAHCIEPSRNQIYYPNKGVVQKSSGMLDVDIINPNSQINSSDKIAVENIVHTDKRRMPEGNYDFIVHCFTKRGGRASFSAELELDGEVHHFNYPHGMKYDEKVLVARVNFDRSKGFKIVKSLPSSVQSKDIWGIKTNTFVPVSVCMFSPNYWDEQVGVGHRHYFFILNGCKNDTEPNGFFNEFLKEDLLRHKRVFEALGGKMRVKPSDAQLSGIGFSETKRNSLVCKLAGSIERTIKLIF
jgi:hypothetical protein